MRNSTETAGAKQPGLREYLSLARFDHITKQVFIIPGIILAYALREPSLDSAPHMILIGFASAIAIASANYVINEWLDREFDAHHPRKSARTAVKFSLSPTLVYTEYLVLAVLGLAMAAMVGQTFLITSVLFLVSGLTYNVRPFRTKDRTYLDVLSESINNPIRLVLGWAMLDPSSLPPGSLLLAYWAGGAFLMSAKRLSEYRDVLESAGFSKLHLYRLSFRGYSSESLIVSCFLYAMMAAFFLAVFLVKYRLEFILAFPFIAGLFASYLWLAMLKNSIAQRPEHMFRSRRLLVALTAAILAMLVFAFLDLPMLAKLTEPSFRPVDMH